MSELENLNVKHKLLRKYRYHYYELDVSLVGDYEYDMLEKEYTEGCDRLGIAKINRIDNYVGFTWRIPMSLLNK